MSAIYPWQQSQWHYITQAVQQKKLPHALLLTGSAGLGKANFAESVANYLLCETPTDIYCNHCRSCQLITAGNHPDLIKLLPENDIIKIDQIRQLAEIASKLPQQAAYRVCIINPAESMNAAAANALLKTLEEPVGNTIFLLVNHQLMGLPATVRSRCQKLVFQITNLAQVEEWLSSEKHIQDPTALLTLADYLPLSALEFADTQILAHYHKLIENFISLSHQRLSALQMAACYLNDNLEKLFTILWKLIADLIRLKAGDTHIIHRQKLAELASIANKISVIDLFTYLDKITQIKSLVLKRSNLNNQLLLEKLFIDWVELSKP